MRSLLWVHSLICIYHLHSYCDIYSIMLYWTVYSERPLMAGFEIGESCWEVARESHLGWIHNTPSEGFMRDSQIWIQSFALIPHPVARWAQNYTIIQVVLPLMTFYWSGMQRNDVYKWDVFVMSWRFHNHTWQPTLSPNSPRLMFLFVDCATANKVYLILSYLTMSWPPAQDIRDTVNLPRGFDQSAMLTSYLECDYLNKNPLCSDLYIVSQFLS